MLCPAQLRRTFTWSPSVPFSQVPPHQPVRLQVRDHRLHRLPPADALPDAHGPHAPLLPADVHHRLLLAVAPVSPVHVRLQHRPPRQAPNLVQAPQERVPVVGVPRQRPAAHHEVALVRHRDARLHPELVAPARLALGDALHLRRVQAVELVLRVPLLRQQPICLGELLREHFRELFVTLRLPPDVPGDAAKERPELPHLPPHALHLPRVRVAVRPEQRLRTLPRVALPKPHAVRRAQPREPFPRAVQQLRIRRERHRLLLHRRVHRHPPEVPLPHRPGTNPRANGRLQQQLAPRLPDPPAEPRHAARVDRRVVLEVHLAAEVLPVGVLHPPQHHRLVRQPVDVLQVLQPDHQPHRPRRTPPGLRVVRPELGLEQPPVDQLAEPHQFVPHVDHVFQAA